MDILIKDAEIIVGKKVRKSAVSYGFDVSEHATGVCVLRTDTSKIYIDLLTTIETNPKDDLVRRMQNFLNSLEKLKQELQYKEYIITAIEDCWLKVFPGGANVECLKHLARFSTLVWMSFKKDSNDIFFILPTSARAQIKFNKQDQINAGNVEIKKITKGKNKGKLKKIDIKLLVIDYIKTAFGVEIKEDNQADGFVLALAGLLR